MIPVLSEHPTPINRVAAKLFWKSPWWARVPEETKAQIERCFENDTEKRIISYFNDPPKTSNKFQPFNRKGIMVYWDKDNRYYGAKANRPYLVTGWADKTRAGNNWWVLIEGQFVRVCGDKIPGRKERF